MPNLALSQKKHEYSTAKCLHHLFWEHAQEQPSSVAVIYEDCSLTYAQLAKSSLSLAIYLQQMGAGVDNCIGLYIEPSLELMVGVWGILTAGSAYLPLAPEYPEERLKYMIKDTGIKIIVTQARLKERLLKLTSQDIQIVTFDDVNKSKELNMKANRLKVNEFEPHHLAYVIYTSGSTGKPKGVMIEHQSVINQMNWLQHAFSLNSQSVIIQKTPISFDAAQWEILAPSCGSTVIIGTSGIYKNPIQLIKTIRKYNVTTLQCVPTLLKALLDTDEFFHCKTLTQIFSGGEALSKHLALECITALPSCSLINLYGPTECTINSSAFMVNPEKLQDSQNIISIGKAIDNLQYYILNDLQEPVPMGEIGELYIGGIGLARGYLNQPALTAEKFINSPFCLDSDPMKLYKTGDLAHWNHDGTVQYVGRIDNQIKLRGFRIELDEIKASIETHDWIKNSAVIVKEDPHTGYQNLIAFVELNPKEAALMDQGNHDRHHQSKENKAQVLMQLSNKGCREKLSNQHVVDLPGKTPTKKQEDVVFARKTYRFFEGGQVSKEDILKLLANDVVCNNFNKIENLSYSNFGKILRYFGQYTSQERLLPKYGYASPGALYATQMYLELDNFCDLKSGYYYYHPIHHQLILIKSKTGSEKTEIKVHFVGKRSAIEPIYKNNIQEVLEIEVGHMVGLFENILPEYGLHIKDHDYMSLVKNSLDVSEEDFYLGTFKIISGAEKSMEVVDIYVQVHCEKVTGLTIGQYQYKKGMLEKISDEIILRKHVIAINQEVYHRSSFGITVISKNNEDWRSYINLGRKLQNLQMNNLNMGLMASGYSSKSGNDLPSAKRMREILGKDIGASHFFVGGRISDEQRRSHGMKEDTVHMKGPAEMLKDDLIKFLPDYMIPNKIIVLDKMPLMVNGKIDCKKLQEENIEFTQRVYIAPRTNIEQKIHHIWKQVIKKENISINDDFFDLGGNSLIAVSLINKMNKELNIELSLQALLEFPTIEKLASGINAQNTAALSRLIQLQGKGSKKPIYCWPGLGGSCINLKLLAKKIGIEQPFYGIQAFGINENETPYLTIQEMAAEDIKLIKKVQPVGPYTLWGYSFGARVAFEVSYQLEQLGEIVDNLFLIAPGSPQIRESKQFNNGNQASYSNQYYVAILLSVFMGSINQNAFEQCLKVSNDEESFIKYIISKDSKLESEIIKRIINIVSKTYEFQYSLSEFKERQLKVPITIFKAQGDNDSFMEKDSHFLPIVYDIFNLNTDHYNVLKNPDIDELINMIHMRLKRVYSLSPKLKKHLYVSAMVNKELV